MGSAASTARAEREQRLTLEAWRCCRAGERTSFFGFFALLHKRGILVGVVAFQVVDLRSVSLNIQPLLLPDLPTLPIKHLLSRV